MAAKESDNSAGSDAPSCHGETQIRTGAFRKHVLVCTFDRPGHCGTFGGLKLLELFREEVDRRQLAKEILVTRAGCTGHHAWGPTVIVYPEGIWYGKVQPEDVSAIIQEHLIDGRPVERLVNRRIGVRQPSKESD